MKALSLWQPWATAVASGLKRVETRHWQTNYRGPLAIHAAKRWTREERKAWERFVASYDDMPVAKLPRGCVVAVAELVDCTPMTPFYISLQTEQERAFGNWAEGRFAWRMIDVRPLVEPLPLKGHQGLWDLSEEEAATVLQRAGGGWGEGTRGTGGD